jgi:hypothetical protein
MSTDFERRLRAARNALPSPDRAVTEATEASVLAVLPSPRRARLRPRTLAIVAAAILAVGAAGFGVGRWVGPSSGSAATPPSGSAPGFIPAEGWNAVSTGLTKPPQASTAIAVDVAFAAESGGVGNLPTNTINHLTNDGVVLFVSLYPRGKHALDAEYPPRKLPLRLSEARLQHGFEGIVPTVALYELKAAVGRWNVDVQAFFGPSHPSSDVLVHAQAELDRLILPQK